MNAPAYEHNGAPCTREAFYAIACDPRRSVAVEACAAVVVPVEQPANANRQVSTATL